MSEPGTVRPIHETYRRFLIDMHIPDWDERFLRNFDPDRFFDALARSGVATVTVPSNGHTGLCYWPSAVGPQHRNAPGLLSSLLEGAHARGLNAVVYYCTLYVERYWEDHPEARIVDALGESRKVRLESYPSAPRFSVCCPNDQGYTDFCKRQLEELCTQYSFEGINLDMMFWPGVCYCGSCAEKYRAIGGRELPRTVDWRSQEWVRFVRARQVWLEEFIRDLTGTITDIKPDCMVTHQSQMYVRDWLLGASSGLADHTAWLSADLYLSAEELSFAFKLFHGLSRQRPFEQISSWCAPSVHEHTVRRTSAELETLASLAISNDAAIVFLEQVDPLGDVQPEGYELIRPINEAIAELEPSLGGVPLRDVAIYYSFESTFDFTVPPHSARDQLYAFEPDRPVPAPESHHRAAVAASRALAEAHVGFGVVSRRDLTELDRYQVLVLPNVVVLDGEEIAAIRQFVYRGGSLYASRETGVLDADGSERKNFGLADVFGVDRRGETEELVTYLSPTAEGADLLAPFRRGLPLAVHARQTLVELAGHEQTVLAELALPFTDPAGSKYASTITDPPGRYTARPAMVRNRFGAGTAVYCAAPLECETHTTQRAVLARLVASLARKPLSWTVQAPPCIEVNVYEQPHKGAVVAHFLNLQAHSPGVPVHGIKFRLATTERAVKRASILGGDLEIELERGTGFVEVTVPTVETLTSVRLTA